ncbi:MAG TPA: Rid family detoxifying hydrolase [Terriglobia bacterium]|nr:Rid family detoxifying hydrolase [Terriglobia bacterium]
MRKVVRTVDAPRPIGVYSQGIVSNGFVFVSGQGAVNPATNEIEGDDVRSQTRQVLRNIRGILEAAGSSLQDVVKLGVFLADIGDFAAMNEVFREFFPEDPPARTTVSCVLPKPVMKVEIDCVARVRTKAGSQRS